MSRSASEFVGPAPPIRGTTANTTADLADRSIYIVDPEIVRRRRNHNIDALIPKARHSSDAIFMAKIEFGHEMECGGIN